MASKDESSRKLGRPKKPKGMPNRPLSAYNLFFREQRAKIVTERADGPCNAFVETTSETKQETGKIGKSGVKDKKKKAESLFESMAKVIAKRWKEISPEELERFTELAKTEQERYRQEIDEYHKNMYGLGSTVEEMSGSKEPPKRSAGPEIKSERDSRKTKQIKTDCLYGTSSPSREDKSSSCMPDPTIRSGDTSIGEFPQRAHSRSDEPTMLCDSAKSRADLFSDNPVAHMLEQQLAASVLAQQTEQLASSGRLIHTAQQIVPFGTILDYNASPLVDSFEQDLLAAILSQQQSQPQQPLVIRQGETDPFCLQQTSPSSSLRDWEIFALLQRQQEVPVHTNPFVAAMATRDRIGNNMAQFPLDHPLQTSIGSEAVNRLLSSRRGSIEARHPSFQPFASQVPNYRSPHTPSNPTNRTQFSFWDNLLQQSILDVASSHSRRTQPPRTLTLEDIIQRGLRGNDGMSSTDQQRSRKTADEDKD